MVASWKRSLLPRSEGVFPPWFNEKVNARLGQLNSTYGAIFFQVAGPMPLTFFWSS